MKKTKKILILIMFIAIMSLGIGYSAIQNITLDIEGTAIAVPTTRILVNGIDFNEMLKSSTSTSIVNTTITKIVFDYWLNGYSENGTVIFDDWETGTPIDVDRLGGIKLFKSSDGTKVYILSEATIYANTNSDRMFMRFEGVTEIVFNNFNTEKVKNMSRMFQECSKLAKLDLSKFETSLLTNMSWMFSTARFGGYRFE